MRQRGNRGKVIVATKVGMEMGADKKGLSKGYILRAVEDSLRRLQTDYIDLYQSHTGTIRKHCWRKRWRRMRSLSRRGRCGDGASIPARRGWAKRCG